MSVCVCVNEIQCSIMVNGDHEKLEANEKADSAGQEQILSTQKDGRDDDDEENLPTQTVASQPSRELQAILRFKPADDLTQREVRLSLPIAPNSENLINLGRLNSNELNSAKYQQLVRLYDPTRPPDKQIISREHSQLLIRQTAPGCFMLFIKDTKDHDRRRTVITSDMGETRLVTHNAFELISHGDVIHLSPLAPPVQGDSIALLEYKNFRLELDFPEAQTQASGPAVADLAEAGHAPLFQGPSCAGRRPTNCNASARRRGRLIGTPSAPSPRRGGLTEVRAPESVVVALAARRHNTMRGRIWPQTVCSGSASSGEGGGG